MATVSGTPLRTRLRTGAAEIVEDSPLYDRSVASTPPRPTKVLDLLTVRLIRHQLTGVAGSRATLGCVVGKLDAALGAMNGTLTYYAADG